jgi:hypothetical protein
MRPLLDLVIAYRHRQFVQALCRIRPRRFPTEEDGAPFVMKCRKSMPNQRAAEINYCKKSQVPYPVFSHVVLEVVRPVLNR